MLNTYIVILFYFGLWLLLGGVVVLAGRVLRAAPVTVSAEDDVMLQGMERTAEGNFAGLAALTLVLSLLLLCWSVLPESGDAALVGAGVPLVVLFIVLLHLRRRSPATEGERP